MNNASKQLLAFFNNGGNMIETGTLLLLCHFVGDFIFQNDWIAGNKKTSNVACLIHALTYLIPFIILNLLTPLQLLLVGGQHFIQDRTNFVKEFMIFKGSKEFSEGIFSPWSVVVTDNILHICWIFLVVSLI